jgi:small-conductance mechanosensitive channel
MAALGLALALVAGGAALHVALGRAARRLPRALARRRGRDAARPPAERAFLLAALAAQGALWVSVAWVASERLAPVMRGRHLLAELLAMSFRMPLFTLDGKAWRIVDLLALPLLLGALWLAVGLAVRVVRARILAPVGVESGLQETVGVLLRYTLVLLGAVVVLQAWGVDVRSLAILASVLGVGIGFGLQNIANNFVSGLLLNVERPIRAGDFVRVGEFLGTVQRIGARSTAIQTPENLTILVPNSRFLESEVVNWSHGSPVSKITLPVGVAYGSDLGRVRAALLDAVKGHPLALRDPRPQVDFVRFGSDAVELELEVWTAEPQRQEELVSDLGFRIDAAFRRAGVEIPFPQRDLHVRSPELARLVAALARRLEGADGEPEGTAREPAAASAEPGAAPAGPGGDPGGALPGEDPRGWSDAELARLAARMRAPDGVPIRDRRHRLAVYPRCFVGSEAVDWLLRTGELTRGEAVAVGQRLVELGFVRHVLDEHGFRDGNFFYAFRDGATG